MGEASRNNPAADYLNSQFLIAMPGMQDPNFHRTVTLVVEHTDRGALGLVVNRPTDVRLRDIYDQLSIEATAEQYGKAPVFMGGPVQPERGFVVHGIDSRWESTWNVSSDVAVTTSRDVLQAMANGDGPDNALVALGYAGWESGQLEEEMARNAWLTVPAEQMILFDTPCEDRWDAAAGLIGIDIALISTTSGHA